jgi:drug/metabolite transporter (DMT)-like permease
LDAERDGVGEWVGVAIALVSSCLGGTAAAITRYLAGNTDPITLAILRWAIGFCCVLPAALLLKARWPQQRDWPAVAALGFCFFGVFFVLYNIAMSYTTAARASLALATLPLHTMVVGALLGSVAALSQFSTPQWIAGIYLGVAGGALAFILWVLALERATPTRVANTMTVNPLAAGLLATQLVDEPITPNLVLGLIAVFAGIWIATSEVRKA